MTPYYADDRVTLWHGDCRELTDWTHADVIVTDPPYGISWQRVAYNGASEHSGIANDGDLTARDEALAMISPQTPHLVFGSPTLPPPQGTRQILVYQKPPDAGMRGAIGGFRRDWEAIYLCGKWPPQPSCRSSVIRAGAPSMVKITMQRYRNDTGAGHPHAKPLDVMETLIDACPAGVIADPFAGSGSTLVAARNLGRHAIGVELNEEYCEIIAKRLAQDAFDFGGAA